MTLAVAPQPIDAEVELSFDEAQERTQELIEAAKTWRDTHNELQVLLIRAYRDGVHRSMNFEGSDTESWNLYLKKHVGPVLRGLDGTDYNAVVESFARAGMSTRAIAAATGKSAATVSRSLSGVANETPTQGLDGKTYTKPKPRPDTFKCDRCGGIKDKDTQLNEIADGVFCERCAEEVDEHGADRLPPAPPKTTAATVADDMKDLRDEALAVADRITALKESAGKSFGKAAQKILADVQAAYAEL